MKSGAGVPGARISDMAFSYSVREREESVSHFWRNGMNVGEVELEAGTSLVTVDFRTDGKIGEYKLNRKRKI